MKEKITYDFIERADLEEIEETIDSISTDEVRLCFQLFVHDTDATADEFRVSVRRFIENIVQTHKTWFI